MNDKFAGQLRQHLLTTANERRADGQLAALDARVAVTAQRRPLVARLTFPGRVGRLSSSALRFGVVAVALALAAVVGAAIIASSPRSPSTVFEGSWTSIDPGDGSTQTLVVGEGSTPSVHFVDNFATGEACFDDPVKVFTADGRGTVAGNHLDVRWPDGGGCGLLVVEMGPGTYTYDQATDTIVDGQPLTWRRVEGAVALPTRGPTTDVTPVPTQIAEPDCIQFDRPGTYTAPAGSLSLTVEVGVLGDQWIGSRRGFDLLKAACTDMAGPGKIQGAEVTQVYTDACAGVSVSVESLADAAAAVSVAKGIQVIGRADVAVGGYAGTRFDMTVPDVPNACPDGQITIVDGLLGFDLTLDFTLYLLDADGKTLALALYGNAGWSPEVVAQVDAILASLRIDTTPAPVATSAAVATPDTGCIQFDSSVTYSAPVGDILVTATLPNAPDTSWQGLPELFFVTGTPCRSAASLTLHGWIVALVPADACHWLGPRTAVADVAGAVAALAEQASAAAGEPTEFTIDGYPGIRLELSATSGFDTEPCDSRQLGLWLTPDGSSAAIIGPGSTITAYLIDVKGSILAITEQHDRADEAEIPGLRGQIDAIIGSLKITP